MGGCVLIGNGLQTRPAHYLITLYAIGPVRSTQMLSALQIFKHIFTNVMYNIIIKVTNSKANSLYSESNAQNLSKSPKIWKEFTLIEFGAFLAMLIECGRNHSNNQHTVEIILIISTLKNCGKQFLCTEHQWQ